MKFHSTRDTERRGFTSAQVIKQGLADDGGLFVPELIPTLEADEIKALSALPYDKLAAKILSLFLTDYSRDELEEDCTIAYGKDKFPEGACKTNKIVEGTYALELWHGPTCAFKDMALALMPRLLSRAIVKTDEKRSALILVATSGDTGKAALEGYKNVERIKIAVFFPEDNVSRIQKLQMLSQEGDNLCVYGVRGNFDDIQTEVKRIFSDVKASESFGESGYFLSSANSINFGRLVPQVVYYFYTYLDLTNKGEIEFGDSLNICVPTGNFGNILAAYIAKLMGLPLGKLICASNKNNVLTDFLSTGIYDKNREFYSTVSPSMDILVSSNLERLLYFTCGPQKTAEYMQALSACGHYRADEAALAAINESFVGYCADDREVLATIKHFFDEYGYLCDTHTAVALSALEHYRNDTGDMTATAVASTASPYKFAKDVYSALSDDDSQDSVSAMYSLSELTHVPIPTPLVGIESRELLFDGVVYPQDIGESVLKFINENQKHIS